MTDQHESSNPPSGDAGTGAQTGASDDAMVDRLVRVRQRIDAARTAAGRSDEVALVAVSKTHPWDSLAAAVDAGVTSLGENRVAELVAKMDHPDPEARLAGVKWHFVGRLQSRKATDLVGRDVLVHSVDRRSLVDRLQRLAASVGTVQSLLVQVNVADDPAKAGCSLQEVDDLVAYAGTQPNLEIAGLMTMPPLPSPADVSDGHPPSASIPATPLATPDPNEAARPHFARLRRLRDRLQIEWPSVAELSMGMSADLDAAVSEGATMVRVGTGVFGPRGDRPWLGNHPLEEAR